MLELKITESVNENALTQVLVYDYLYKRSQRLQNLQLRSFLLSSKTVAKKTLSHFQYKETKWKGVYQSELPGYRTITLLILNKLENTIYNAPVKCFCSRKKEQEKAFQTLKQEKSYAKFSDLGILFWGIRKIWGLNEKEQMKLIDVFPPTPENLEDFHNFFGEHYLQDLPLEKKLKGVSSEEILERMSPEERLKGMSSEEILGEMSLEEIKNFLSKKTKKNN